MAWCPICQVQIWNIDELCPHVAVVVPPGGKYGAVHVDGVLQGWYPSEILDLNVLTNIGWLSCGSTVYLAPAPGVYFQALEEAEETDEHLEDIYKRMWYKSGMEGYTWHE